MLPLAVEVLGAEQKSLLCKTILSEDLCSNTLGRIRVFVSPEQSVIAGIGVAGNN